MPEMRDYVKQTFLQHLYAIDTERQKRYKTYREYYDGDHATQLTKRQRRTLEVKGDERFRDNYCPLVVDAMSERLHVTGFTVGESSREVDDVNDSAVQLWDWWQANRMDARSGDAHLAAVRDGDAFVLVSWDEERQMPKYNVELAYDGSDGVKIHYSDEDRGVVLFASKRWVVSNIDDPDTGNKRRLNLYYPDEIQKFVSNDKVSTGNWEKYTDEDDPRWPIPWTETGLESGEPLGVPMIHFKYKGGGHSFGKSRLRDVISLQNDLNRCALDISTASEYEGFGLLYAIGDKWGAINVNPGTVLKSERPANEVDIGRVPAGDLSALLAHKDSLIYDIARVSNTPLSNFQLSGQLAAEGTLKQQESGLVADVITTQLSFGNSWEDVQAMARKLFNVFGTGGMNEDDLISTEWSPAAVRDETELINRLAIMAEKLHIPDVVLWDMAGLDAEQIEMAQNSDQYQATQSLRGSAMMLNEENRES